MDSALNNTISSNKAHCTKGNVKHSTESSKRKLRVKKKVVNPESLAELLELRESSSFNMT